MKKLFVVFLITLIMCINPVLAYEWYSVSELSNNEQKIFENAKNAYDDYEIGVRASFTSDTPYPNAYMKIDRSSKFSRFVVFCNADINKCGLYDLKKDKFTGYKYKMELTQTDKDGKILVRINNPYSKSNEIQLPKLSGVPIVVENGKKKSIQPFKRIGNSIVRVPIRIGENIFLFFGLIIYLIIK